VRIAVQRYQALFANPGVVRVLLASLIGRLPMGMSTLLFVLVVHAGTGSYRVAGLATAANSAVMAVTSPLLGRWADRGRAGFVVAASGIAQALALVALVSSLRMGYGPLTAVALSGLAGAANPPIGAVTRVVLPRLARSAEQGRTAYAVDAVLVEMTFVVGPLVVGVVAALSSVYIATLLAAVLTALGSLGLASAPGLRRGYRSRTDVRGARPKWGPLSSAQLRAVLLIGVTIAAAYGVLEVAIPGYAQAIGQPDAGGLIVAAWSSGSIIGGLWFSGRDFATPLRKQYIVLMALNLAGFAAVFLASGLISLAILLFLGGLFIAPATAVESALITELAPPGTETEAFTWSGTSIYLGFAGGSALVGTVLANSLQDTGGLMAANVLATGLVVAGTLVAVFGLRRRIGR
jgi:MFS family permease